MARALASLLPCLFQILLGAIGGGDDDGDVQVVDACTDVTIHGNVGWGPRGAFLRCVMILLSLRTSNPIISPN